MKHATKSILAILLFAVLCANLLCGCAPQSDTQNSPLASNLPTDAPQTPSPTSEPEAAKERELLTLFNGDKYALFYDDGTQVTDFIYSSIQLYDSCVLLGVSASDLDRSEDDFLYLYAIADTQGNLLTDFRYGYAVTDLYSPHDDSFDDNFSPRVAAFAGSETNQYVLVDLQTGAELMVVPNTSYFLHLNDDTIAVTDDETDSLSIWSIPDLIAGSAEPLYTCTGIDYAVSDNNSSIRCVRLNENGTYVWRLILPDGLSKNSFAQLDAYANSDPAGPGLAFATLKENGPWGIVDSAGNWVAEPQFDSIGSFCDGLAVVSNGGLYSYVDQTGTVVIPGPYVSADWFYDGFAQVTTLDGRALTINTAGETVFDCHLRGFYGFNGAPATIVELDNTMNADGNYKSVVLMRDGTVYELPEECRYLGLNMSAYSDDLLYLSYNAGTTMSEYDPTVLIYRLSDQTITPLERDYNSVFPLSGDWLSTIRSAPDGYAMGYREFKGTYVQDILDQDGGVILENLNVIYSATENALAVKKGFSCGIMDYQGNWLYQTSTFTTIPQLD